MPATATNAVMMLAGPALRVVPLTVHIPLAEVPERLTADLIVAAFQGAKPGSYKGVIVLFIGDKADEQRVETAMRGDQVDRALLFDVTVNAPHAQSNSN